MAKRRTKRTLSPEQIRKMQEGRKRAQEAREQAAITRKRVAALADLEESLRRGAAESQKPVRLGHRRRRYR